MSMSNLVNHTYLVHTCVMIPSNTHMCERRRSVSLTACSMYIYITVSSLLLDSFHNFFYLPCTGWVFVAGFTFFVVWPGIQKSSTAPSTHAICSYSSPSHWRSIYLISIYIITSFTEWLSSFPLPQWNSRHTEHLQLPPASTTPKGYFESHSTTQWRERQHGKCPRSRDFSRSLGEEGRSARMEISQN